MTMTRREFVDASAYLLAGAAILPAPLWTRRPSPNPQRILIAGAGMSGLVAAYELQRAGHEVLVFEAKSIPGGHVMTLRAPFADGLYAEAGAAILAGHPLTVGYVSEFELPAVEVDFRTELGSVAHIAGQRVEVQPGEPVRWPVALEGEEKGETIRQLQRRYHCSRLGDPESLDWSYAPKAARLAFDDVSLAELWRRNGASDGALRLMRLRYFDGYGDGIETVSTLQVIRELTSFGLGVAPPFQVRGGNDLLPRALAERLSERVRYGSPVVAVRHDDASVEITIEDRAGRHQVRGDLLILTLPPPLLRQIAFTPALPERRQRAIQAIDTTPMTLAFMQCRERFWVEDGNDGSANTDLPIQQILHATLTQQGTRGILQAMTYGSRASRLAAMDAEERLPFVVAETTKVHPRLLEFYEGGTSYSWTNDPWSLGGHVFFKPGQYREFFPYIQRPEGRIHFAGDWIAGLPGYLHGAVMSAHAVVKSIEAG